VSNARFGAMVEGDVAQKLHSAVVRQGVRIALGGKIDPSFAGGMLTLEVELVSIRTGRLIGDGPMIHELRGRFGPAVVVRVGGIELLVVSIATKYLICTYSNLLISTRRAKVSWR